MQDGLLISSLRQEKQISQARMAQLLKVSLTTYKFYEQEIRPMDIERLNIICNYFNLSIDYLLRLTNLNNYHVYQEKIDYTFLKINLKQTRQKYKIRQVDLAKEFNISLSSIQTYENKTCKLNSDFLIKFSNKFNISIDYLCGKTLKPKYLKEEA